MQDQLFALGLFITAERIADGVDQLGDRDLDAFEFADLVLGVHQEIADCLVLLAELGSDRKEQLIVEFDLGLACRGVGGFDRRHWGWFKLSGL